MAGGSVFYRLFGSLVTGILSLAVCFSVSVDAQRLPPNLDLLVETLEDAVDQVLAEVSFPIAGPEAPLIVKPQGKHAANWVVDHLLAERLLAKGIAVSLDTTAIQSSDLTLTYRILDLKVTGQTGLWGRRIDRRSRVLVSFNLTQDEVMGWQQEFAASKRDWVPKKRADLLENERYSFAKTELTTQSWGQFFEPIIISGVLGGLLYMFFSNR